MATFVGAMELFAPHFIALARGLWDSASMDTVTIHSKTRAGRHHQHQTASFPLVRHDGWIQGDEDRAVLRSIQDTCVFTFAAQENHTSFGRLMEQHADQLALAEAPTVVSITDGARWIRNRILEHLPYIDAMLLDFYHLSEHIRDTARCCLGESDEAGKWAKDQLHEIRHMGPAGVLSAIATLSRKVRSTGKRKSLRLLRNYLIERWEMVDYRRALASGWDIGSGPTEAMSRNLTLRLKRTGMKWDPKNAAAVMNLVALRESGQWDRWWQPSAA